MNKKEELQSLLYIFGRMFYEYEEVRKEHKNIEKDFIRGSWHIKRLLVIENIIIDKYCPSEEEQ